MRCARLLLVSAFAATLLGQPARNSDLQRIRADIARLRQRLSEVHAQARSAEHDLEAVDLELDIRTRELQLAVDMQSQLEAQQQEIGARIATLTPRLDRQKIFLRKRLAALYRLGELSYLRLLLSMNDQRNPIEAVSMLTFLVSHDARAVTRFQTERAQLAAQQVQLADRERELAQTRTLVEQRRRAVAAAHVDKERLLVSLRQQEAGSEKQIAELEEKAKRLERLVGVLQNKPGAAATADIRTVAGALPWPVAGNVVEHFGPQRNAKYATVVMSNGLKIAAPPGEEVHAVFTGTVLFSQWFKGYGNLVIVDHGNRVVSLYGNLKSPVVNVGDRVNAGQAIAGVGEAEDASSGYLYFEIRHDNKPEDPQKWLR
jgi:septal ring factor EnvC (AmiA/AmiB activator)